MISLGVSVDDRDGVRHVVLDRADKKNALTRAMYAAMADAIDSAADDDIGAILFEARGDTFSAGNDLRDFLAQPPRDHDAPPFRFLYALARAETPLVAAVRGAAVGIGTTMLLHCDLVYASPTARFRTPFVDLGLVPEAASSVLLPRRIGRARAGAILYLGETMGADQASADGLVTKVVADDALDAEADAAARAIAAKPREAVRATKRLITHDREEIVATIVRESVVFSQRLVSEEARAAMSAFFDRGGNR